MPRSTATSCSAATACATMPACAGCETDQTIGGYVSVSDPRNSHDPDGAGPLPRRSARAPSGDRATAPAIPTSLNFVTTENKYDNWLPSATRRLQRRRACDRPRRGVADDDPAESQRDAAGPELQLALGRHRHGRQPGAESVHLGQFRSRLRILYRRRRATSASPPSARRSPASPSTGNDTVPFSALAAVRHDLRHADPDPAGGDQLARRPGLRRTSC